LQQARVPFGSQGYGSMFISSILDKHYKPGLTMDEAVALLKRCIAEVQKRLLVQLPTFKTRVIDKDGVRVIEI
jgi:20S proteasome subunit beta 4